MAKTIAFDYDGTAYTLEYTRNSLKKMLKAGLDLQGFAKDPLNNGELIARGAFLAHHEDIKEERAVEIICALMPNEDNPGATVLNTLVEMVTEAMEETVLKKTGTVKWTVTA